MAKIPLRAYIKEIENLIERGEIEPAIAHAKNILRAYPKSIETYRLLGKAYLESQRYSEAGDILQRVLSVVPDDFISQIGMSIIREDEGNMDAAIWHMERAYEVQPFNPAVQDELRRLYGRRDGVEPPKIRLTRGALVRMYTRGELYPQAIAETRAALAEDPQRYDLRVLLARLYYQTGQKNDAAEVCSELIAKLPYCYEANRLLAEILPTTSRADETTKFQQRIYALNPYEAFVSPSAPTSAQVPDQAVMVEETVWEPDSETEQSPDWARTVGAAWEDSEPEEVLPEWLNTLKPEAPAPVESASDMVMPEESAFPGLDDDTGISTISTGDVEAENLVPDWMKEAGWTPSDRPADEVMADQDETNQEGEIEPAEIPDWLQSLAPAETEIQTGEEQDRTDWLDDILMPSASAAEGQDEQLTPPAELAGEITPGAPEPSLEESELTTPNWISGLEIDEQPAQSADLPDWLAQMQEDQTQEPSRDLSDEMVVGENQPDAVQFTDTTEPAPLAEADDLPDWLKSFETEPEAGASETISALPEQELTTDIAQSDEIMLESDEPGTVEQEGALAGDLPDWLQSLGEETDQAVEEIDTSSISVESTIAEGDEFLPAEPEETVAAASSEITGASVDENSPAMVETAASVEDAAQNTPAMVDSTIEETPDFSDTDATMAWLEALAARQGADEATLITAPEDRSDTLPEWLRKESEEAATAEVDADALAAAAAATGAAAIYHFPETPEELEISDETEAAVAEEQQDISETMVVGDAQVETEEEPPQPEWLAEDSQTIIDEVSAESVVPVLSEDEMAMAESQQTGAGEELEPHEISVELGESVAEQLTDLRAATEVREELEAQAEPVDSAEVTEAGETATPDLSNMDDAMAWLEALAARQGADEATLITPIEDRTDTPPDWVAEIKDEVSLPEVAPVDEANLAETAEETGESASEEVLPDWLKDTASWSTNVADEGKLDIAEFEDQQEGPQAIPSPKMEEDTQVEAVEPDETPDDDMPDWIKDIQSEPMVQINSEDAVHWVEEQDLQGEGGSDIPTWMGINAEHDQSTSAGDETIPTWLADLQDESDAASADVAAHTNVDYHTAWGPEVVPDRPSEEITAPESPTSLADLQNALNEGRLDTALEGYSRLIENDENLEEVIRDLREALYRFPVDISLWQTLGDAYSRSDQLQEALDAYTKAEELLR